MDVTLTVREMGTDALASSGNVAVDDGSSVTNHSLSSGVATFSISSNVKLEITAVLPNLGSSACGYDLETDAEEEQNVWLGAEGTFEVTID